MLKHKHRIQTLTAALLLAVCCLAPASAATTPATDKTDSASSIQTVAQSYGTPKALQQGLIVQADTKNKANVLTATYKNASKMLGVTVAASAAPVTLSSDAAGQRVYVVTSGRYNVLVSTQNGSIDAGDFVSISAIDGLGMKADTIESTILGRAASGFDGKKDVISNTTLKTADGKNQKAAIGSIPVDISVIANPIKATGESNVPSFIQSIAVSVVGKPISAPQLYASLAVMVVGIGVVASLLYGGIQTGMTAIGRNPLAKQSILRNMIQVIVAGLMIFIGCLVAVYLILKI